MRKEARQHEQAARRPGRLRWWSGCCLALVLCLGIQHPGLAADITLLSPSTDGIYRQFNDSFHAHLKKLCEEHAHLSACVGDDGVEFLQVSDAFEGANLHQSGLLISLGSEAGKQLAASETDAARLLTLLPASSYESIRSCCYEANGAAFSGVFVDQPVERYFWLIREALPATGRVGMLLSPRSSVSLSELKRLSKAYGLSLETATISDVNQLGKQLKALLKSVDVLLAIPDPEIYNAATISSILLTTYHQEVPVIGYSETFVNAGGIAAVYTSIDQIAEDTANQTIQYFEKGRLDRPHYTRQPAVKINQDVARSLELQCPSSEQLEQGLLELGQ